HEVREPEARERDRDRDRHERDLEPGAAGLGMRRARRRVMPHHRLQPASKRLACGNPSHPARTEPAASTQSGTVMMDGDSCGWCCVAWSARHSPKKTMKTWRNM